jgi:hypothetical protein
MAGCCYDRPDLDDVGTHQLGLDGERDAVAQMPRLTGEWRAALENPAHGAAASGECSERARRAIRTGGADSMLDTISSAMTQKFTVMCGELACAL